MTTFDPDFSEHDIASALGWLEHKRDQCPGCGHSRSETFDPERVNAYKAEPLVCHACQARDQAVRKFRKDKGDEDGAYWVVREREVTGG